MTRDRPSLPARPHLLLLSFGLLSYSFRLPLNYGNTSSLMIRRSASKRASHTFSHPALCLHTLSVARERERRSLSSTKRESYVTHSRSLAHELPLLSPLLSSHFCSHTRPRKRRRRGRGELRFLSLSPRPRRRRRPRNAGRRLGQARQERSEGEASLSLSPFSSLLSASLSHWLARPHAPFPLLTLTDTLSRRAIRRRDQELWRGREKRPWKRLVSTTIYADERREAFRPLVRMREVLRRATAAPASARTEGRFPADSRRERRLAGYALSPLSLSSSIGPSRSRLARPRSRSPSTCVPLPPPPPPSHSPSSSPLS